MRRFFFMTLIKHALCSLAWIPALLLAACHASPPHEPNDQEVTRAEALRPADAQLAAKYERSCQACHGVRSAAPLTGFEPAWAPRVAKGADVLLQKARDGFNGMPAKGLCSDCTDDDLRGLIAFMSQPAL
ncbi:c-type cytochrome [Aquabacterium sp.]|uniref:c-type cytochrome n=1 Tax=Aquabacterium sp. TaxID=1872578 RepID=UPI0025BB6D91|nr:c-type cytochrome [Aquabacterium sp.]